MMATLQSLPGSNWHLAPWVVVLIAGLASSAACGSSRGASGLMALLERDQGDELTRNHQRQRIAVEALGREKLDELND